MVSFTFIQVSFSLRGARSLRDGVRYVLLLSSSMQSAVTLAVRRKHVRLCLPKKRLMLMLVLMLLVVLHEHQLLVVTSWSSLHVFQLFSLGQPQHDRCCYVRHSSPPLRITWYCPKLLMDSHLETSSHLHFRTYRADLCRCKPDWVIGGGALNGFEPHAV